MARNSTRKKSSRIGWILSFLLGCVVMYMIGMFTEEPATISEMFICGVAYMAIFWVLRMFFRRDKANRAKQKSKAYNSRSRRSASASYYDSNAKKKAEAERRRKKQEADEAVRERTRKANQDAYNRYKNIDNAIYQDYLSKQSSAGSYDEEWHKNQADWYEDEAKKY